MSQVNERLQGWMYVKALACLGVLACVGCLSAAAIVQAAAHWHESWPWGVLAAAAAEAAFAAAWRKKYKKVNEQPAPRHAPQDPAFNPRQALSKFLAEAQQTRRWICLKQMLSAWFGGAPLEDIWADNVAELISYGFFYMSREELLAAYGHDAQLLVHELEEAWGLKFKPGYNPRVSFMAHLWQPIRCSYRPLAFYLGVEVLFVVKHCLLLAMGFSSSTCKGFKYYTYTPAQQQRQGQPKLPVLFQHGVGLGLLPYIMFVARVAATGHPVVAVECGHLGMRWVRHIPDADTVVSVIAEVLQHRLGWTRVCAAGHSYGTFYASRLRQQHPQLVAAMALMDPVAINMFTGKLIKSFVYEPHRSSLITWLVARDVHHAASVCRNFFWSQLNLWPDALPDHTLVVLSDADELVPVKETVAMLHHAAPHAMVLHHPAHAHADFIRDLPWQYKVVSALVDMLDQAAGTQAHPHQAGHAPGRWQDTGSPSAACTDPQDKWGGAARSPKQHDRSDSASSYDNMVCRLRHKPCPADARDSRQAQAT